MKKISLITIFDNPNFGTYLQALALGVVLERYDTKVEIVHYERPIWHTFSSFRKKTKFLEPLRILKAYIRGHKRIIQQYECRKFVRKYLKITPPYYSYEELKKNPPQADIYLTGSDQVWNTIHNHGVDKSFYLGYAPKDKPKYAYAASIGMNEIPEEYKIETKGLLEQYKAITVREESNVILLQNLGIKSSLVLDPTLLLTSDEWKKYENKSSYPELPYVLIYSVESEERGQEVLKIAREVANELKCKIFEVSYYGEDKRIEGCDGYYYYATPDLFISLVSNARFIVGSSFHITAFSINYNKNFITVTPDRFSSRIDSLLKLTALQRRKITSIKEYDKSLLESIDFSYANRVMHSKREWSLRYVCKIAK